MGDAKRRVDRLERAGGIGLAAALRAALEQFAQIESLDEVGLSSLVEDAGTPIDDRLCGLRRLVAITKGDVQRHWRDRLQDAEALELQEMREALSSGRLSPLAQAVYEKAVADYKPA